MKRTINTNIKMDFGNSFLLLILSLIASYTCFTLLLQNSAKETHAQNMLYRLEYTLFA